MRIDAHQHFWLMQAREGQWPPASLTAIYRDFQPQDLIPLLADTHMDGTVVVQSLPSEADTDYLLSLASQHAFILGVVGWVDLLSPEAPERIRRFAANPCFKGVRPMLQSEADDNWICQPALTPAIAALQANGLSFDALVLPRQLPGLLQFARRHPELPIVIDHAAKPEIALQQWDEWAADMTSLATCPNVFCKMSGLLTEAGIYTDTRHLAPYVDLVLQQFGAQRVMWGSDWPVLNLAGQYADWVNQSEALLAHLTPAEKQAVFGGTASAFYRLVQQRG